MTGFSSTASIAISITLKDFQDAKSGFSPTYLVMEHEVEVRISEIHRADSTGIWVFLVVLLLNRYFWWLYRITDLI